MANGQTITARSSRKPTKAEFNAFMCKVLDPLPDAETMDRDLAKLERKAARAARERSIEELRFNWQWGFQHVKKAEAQLEFLYAQTWIDRGGWRGRDNTPAECVAASKAQEAFHAACARQVLIPAPIVVDLNWKKRTWVFRNKATPEMLAAVEADEARLTPKSEGRA
jgi:hypothetical protein